MMFRTKKSAPQADQSTLSATQQMAAAIPPVGTFETSLSSAVAQIEQMKSGLRAINCEVVLYKNRAGFHMFMHTPCDNSLNNHRMLLALELQGEEFNGQCVSISVTPSKGKPNGLLERLPHKTFMPDGTSHPEGGKDLNTFIYESIIESLGPCRQAELAKANGPFPPSSSEFPSPKQMS